MTTSGGVDCSSSVYGTYLRRSSADGGAGHWRYERIYGWRRSMVVGVATSSLRPVYRPHRHSGTRMASVEVCATTMWVCVRSDLQRTGHIGHHILVHAQVAHRTLARGVRPPLLRARARRGRVCPSKRVVARY